MNKNLFHFPKTKIFNIIQMRIFLKITQNCNKLKNNITNTMTKDYVDSGILTNDKFNLEVNSWINSIE